jgi:2-oxoglutarate ferredoxin oxidoreductase subunit alpha
VCSSDLARVAQTAVKEARARGMRVGLFRPISLWPFPSLPLAHLSERVDHFLVVEMSAGQMVEDVRLAVGSQPTVEFFGRTGGMVPMPDEVFERIATIVKHMTPRIHDAWDALPEPLLAENDEMPERRTR